MSVHEQIIKQNIAFVYGRSKEEAKHDPDKRIFVKSVKPVDPLADLGPIISSFVEEFEALHPAYICKVINFVDRKSGHENNKDIIVYPSFEHALMASKIVCREKKLEIVSIPSIPEVKRFVAKELKKENTEVENWKENCLKIAEALLRDKFLRNKSAKSALMKSEKRPLQYLNEHKDLFWGIDHDKKGQNNLGKLMMKIREDIVKGVDVDLWIAGATVLEKADNVSMTVTVKKGPEVIKEDCKVIDRKSLVYIGKHDRACDIVSLHPSTSRVHAAVLVDRELGPVVVDLDSANGTVLNGEPLQPCLFTPITKQDLLAIGASSRCYLFDVETQATVKRSQVILQKLADQEANFGAPTSSNETTVFVRNIPYEATDRDLQEFFASCGKIVQVSVPRDRQSGQSKGIAFVSFSNLSGVLQAVGRDGDELLGRAVRVKRSDAAGSGPASAGGGGGGGAKRISQQPYTDRRGYGTMYRIALPTHNSFQSPSGSGGGDYRQDRDRGDRAGARDEKDYYRSREDGQLSSSSTAVTNKAAKEVSNGNGKGHGQGQEEQEYDYSYYMNLYRIGADEEESTKKPSAKREDQSPPRRPRETERKRDARNEQKKDDSSPPRSSAVTNSSGKAKAAESEEDSPPRRPKKRGDDDDASPPRRQIRSERTDDESPPRKRSDRSFR